MMSFGLKNARATYQMLVNKMFVDLIGKTMEVYVDNMLVKSLKADDHVMHLNDTFRTVKRYRMKLNPLKCAFSVAFGKFLGYMVNQRGIKANLEKINTLLELRSPQKPKEVENLTGQVAALNCFVFMATNKCLMQASLLSKPKPGNILQLYLVVSNEAISTVLIREEETTQLLVYYTSKALLSLETRYPGMEKLALALITASRKLRPYFQAHTIHVLTNFPLRQVLQKSNASGRLLKWAVELSKFDIVFKTRAVIKGQTLPNFVTEFTNVSEVEEVMEPIEPPTWSLFVDGSAENTGSRAGVVLVSLEGHKLNSGVKFRFKATNNAAEYHALFAGLRLAKKMQIKRLRINSDSQLVVSQVNGSFLARDKTMASYLKMALNFLPSFEKYKIMQILCLENAHADALSKLASSKDSELFAILPIEHLLTPSTEVTEVIWVDGIPTWMQPIIAYLKDQVLPTDKDEAYKLRRRSTHFLFIDDVLYKRSFSFSLLRCTREDKTIYILREIHEGELTAIFNLWPFSKWGVDLIGPLPKGRGGVNFAIVAIDYFTKWVEHFLTPRHPQANGQVEAVNKTIKHVFKRRMDASKEAWVDELVQVIWVIRTTTKTPTGKTPFLMAYGIEAMSPVEVDLPSPCHLHFSEISNDELRKFNLDFIDKRRDDS
ncbi:uncharacterized protein LOC111371087 [Olea europaea var. sylvestris]|uniref:uncharacterized protein LOC111371087 n=1 Tax=Olea europaea var. sylvestris TaxID=158386 RepID=UPI000C1D3841|nr:uncharacterized protein LOC111371087 [Olea europaea var. sylvestris]